MSTSIAVIGGGSSMFVPGLVRRLLELECFDDAELRRGKPSVHKAFGEPLAVLAGDSLILLAFQSLGLPAHL